jgi:hypothetical protein
LRSVLVPLFSRTAVARDVNRPGAGEGDKSTKAER